MKTGDIVGIKAGIELMNSLLKFAATWGCQILKKLVDSGSLSGTWDMEEPKSDNPTYHKKKMKTKTMLGFEELPP